MSIEKLFYLAKVFDGLSVVFQVFLIISAIVFVVTTIVALANYYDEGEKSEYYKTSSKWAKILFPIVLLNIVGYIFTPDKETFLFMMGGKVVDTTIQNNPEIKELPGNTINLLNEFIEAETDKIRKSKGVQ
jgi:Na+/alanine symporter